MALHADEVPVTDDDVARLLRSQAPQWATLPVRPAGEGTDNVMRRLGDDLVIRIPRRPSTAESLAKERRWIPHLAPHLPVAVPEVVFSGEPDDQFPFPWAVYRWIDGAEPTTTTVDDWATFGRDLAEFTAALHAVDTAGATREGPLSWYRGSPLAENREDGFEAIHAIRRIDAQEPVGFDVDAVEQWWAELVDVPQRPVADVWLHGDLRSANLLARDGALRGVIDFGCLSVGQPVAEHSAAIRLPREAADAYRTALGVDDAAWALAHGWVLLPQLTGLPYYWDTWRGFAEGCGDEIRRLLSLRAATA